MTHSRLFLVCLLTFDISLNATIRPPMHYIWNMYNIERAYRYPLLDNLFPFTPWAFIKQHKIRALWTSTFKGFSRSTLSMCFFNSKNSRTVKLINNKQIKSYTFLTTIFLFLCCNFAIYMSVCSSSNLWHCSCNIFGMNFFVCVI